MALAIARGLPEGARRTDGPVVAVTIGSFDGVHRGHRALIDEVRAAASRDGGEAAIVTFDPHPRCVLTPDRCPATLTGPDEKARLFDASGVDHVRVLPFDHSVSLWTAGEFMERLAAAFHLRRVVVGNDFALGHGRQGTVSVLRDLCAEHGVTVDVVTPLMEGADPISSSRVRACLAEGDVHAAAGLLGRPHVLTGVLDRRGVFSVASDLCIPAEGEYGVHVEGAISVGQARDHSAGRPAVARLAVGPGRVLTILGLDDDPPGVGNSRCALIEAASGRTDDALRDAVRVRSRSALLE